MRVRVAMRVAMRMVMVMRMTMAMKDDRRMTDDGERGESAKERQKSGKVFAVSSPGGKVGHAAIARSCFCGDSVYVAH